MKKTFLFFIIVITCFYYSFSQQSLTLEDAVVNRWTSLAPDRLKNLQWNNEEDFFSYKADSTIYIFDYNNTLKDSISLNQINEFLDGEEKLLSTPNITWISAHSFRFKNNTKYYRFNTQRDRKSNFWFELDKEASNVEFSNQQDRCAYTIENNLYVHSVSEKPFQITNEANKDIIFGQPVHRYEFGIYKGTFWSPSGDHLAFYRKDESMVSDYPLMNISSRVGHADMIKYPMAGMSSHHVSVGVFNAVTHSWLGGEVNNFLRIK